MATYRANTKEMKRIIEQVSNEFGINKQELQNACDNALARTVRNVANKVTIAHQKLFKNGVATWFDIFDSDNIESLIESTYFTYKIKQFKSDGLKQFMITSYSHVNIDDYTYYKYRSIDRWARKYESDIDTGKFILNLQFKQGILGLPKKWTRPNLRLGVVDKPYINPNFMQDEPLAFFLYGSIDSNKIPDSGGYVQDNFMDYYEKIK